MPEEVTAAAAAAAAAGDPSASLLREALELVVERDEHLSRLPWMRRSEREWIAIMDLRRRIERALGGRPR